MVILVAAGVIAVPHLSFNYLQLWGYDFICFTKPGLAVVIAARRVAYIVKEISAASQEQHHEIEQVNRAIADMDRVTQQNSALVEQAAAAAQSMQAQARNLASAVSIFKLTGNSSDINMPTETGLTINKRLPAEKRIQAKIGNKALPRPAGKQDFWPKLTTRSCRPVTYNCSAKYK